MSLGPIGASGGMDINSMVKKIVDSERIPKQQSLDKESSRISTSISAYGRLRESLDSMKNLMMNFRQEKAFAERSVSSSDDSIVTATATTDAIAGKYAVDVLQLAQSHKIASGVLSKDGEFGPGKLHISLGSRNFDVNVARQSRLTDIVRNINGSRANPGIRASIINDVQGPRLILASNLSGKANQIAITVDGQDQKSNLNQFAYTSHEQKVEALEAARKQAQELLAPKTENKPDDKLTSQSEVSQAENKSVKPEDNIPGWTETASGTLLNSYISPEKAQKELEQEKQALQQNLQREQAKLEKRVASGELSAEQAKQMARDTLTPQQRDRLDKIERAQTDLNNAERAMQQKSSMVQIQAGQDAKVTLDGVATLSSHNNIIKNAIEGVDLTLKGETSKGKPATDIDVEYNRTSVRKDIQSFVSAYNQFYQLSKSLTQNDPASGKAGPLAGDSTVRNADSRLKALFSSTIEGAPEHMQRLTEFGITTTRSGALEINNDILDRQITNHFTELGEFFGGRHGFARRVEDTIQSMTGVTGSIRTREKTLNDQNYRLRDNQAALDRRMGELEKRTHDKFAAMQDATGKMQGQLTALQNSLG